MGFVPQKGAQQIPHPPTVSGPERQVCANQEAAHTRTPSCGILIPPSSL